MMLETLDVYAETYKESINNIQRERVDRTAMDFINENAEFYRLTEVQSENLKNYYVSKKYNIE